MSEGLLTRLRALHQDVSPPHVRHLVSAGPLPPQAPPPHEGDT